MQIVKRVFLALWRALNALRLIIGTVIFLGFLVLLGAALHQSTPIVPARAALLLHPNGHLVEQLSARPWQHSLNALAQDKESETLVRDLLTVIRAAKTDPRIKVMVLDLEDLEGGGLGKLQTVAAEIESFRKSGKKVLAFGRYVSQEQFYLMAHADESYIDPDGAVGIMGFSTYHLYFHDALEKLGVDINVFKVGTHKSFTEPYTRQGMSPEDREQTIGWLTPIWSAYRAGVEQARHLKDGVVGSYAQDAASQMRAVSGDTALLAEQQGLVTGRKTSLQFEQQLIALVGEDETTHSFNAIDGQDYLQAVKPAAGFGHKENKVAVVVAAGTIMGGDQPAGAIGGDSLARLLRDVRFDKDVKAVVLRIDSGGGSMLASEVIRQELDALKASGKPVIASFGSVAASGGYYIGMDADEIWAEPTTISGSIGVFGLVPTFQKTLAKIGVASDGIETGPIAGTMNLERSLDPAARDVLQLGVEHAYHSFVARVADARHRPVAEIEKIAEGRVWIGTRAQEIGLVDQIGSLDQAIASAATRAKLKPGQYDINYREKNLNWRESLLRQLSAEGRSVAGRLNLVPSESTAAARMLGALDAQMHVFAGFNDPRHIYAYCACIPD